MNLRKSKNQKNWRNAFTLAEVLITLAIIGVVAALTLPTLVQNYKKHVVETKLAKFYTTINQAVAMSNTQNGEPADWVKDCGTSAHQQCTIDETLDWFKSYIGKYIVSEKIETNSANAILIYFNDGTIMKMPSYIYDIYFYVSEKSLKNSLLGINTFRFRFSPKFNLLWASAPEEYKYTIKDTIEPYTYHWDGELTSLYNDEIGIFGCQNGDGSYCTKLIQMNGWKIPKDYPLKF